MVAACGIQCARGKSIPQYHHYYGYIYLEQQAERLGVTNADRVSIPVDHVLHHANCNFQFGVCLIGAHCSNKIGYKLYAHNYIAMSYDHAAFGHAHAHESTSTSDPIGAYTACTRGL